MQVREVKGRAAIRALIDELFQSPPDEVLGLSDLDALIRVFPEFEYREANTSRLKAGVASRFLYTSIKGPIYAVNDTTNNRHSRWVPYLPFGDITIIGDNLLVTYMADEPWAIVFHSPEVVEAFKQLFEVFWEKSKEFNQ